MGDTILVYKNQFAIKGDKKISLDGFITFLTLMAAVYALMSPIKRFHIKFNIRIQAFFAFIMFSLIIYLEFFPALKQPCPDFLGQMCKSLSFPTDQSITPSQVAFIAVIVWFLIALFINRIFRINAGVLPELSHVFGNLVDDKRFSDALELIDPYIPLIDRSAKRQLCFQSLYDKLKQKTQNNPFDNLKHEFETNQTNSKTIISISIINFLLIFIPTQKKQKPQHRI